MAELKDRNYISIQAFMVKDLGLKGNELITYALIYGFSQDGENYFRGSLAYIAEWLNCSKNTAYNIVKSLVDKGFLDKKEKEINKVKFCEYMAIIPNEKDKNKNLDRHTKNLDTHTNNSDEGVQKSCINNILNNLENNIQDNINNSLSNDKDNSKTKVLELHNSPVSEETKQEAHVLKTLGRKTHTPKQAPLKDMPTRAREIAERLVDNTETADKVSDCISYFLEQYKAHRHKEHIHLTNDKLHDVVVTMLSTITIQHENDSGMFESDYNPLVANNVDMDDMHWVIDEYFQTKFRENTDYSLVHFTQDGVLTNVMNKCMLGGNPWYESHSL